MPEIKVSQEWRGREREVKSIRKDIETARKIIADGFARYKKKMLHARSLKQAEDLSMFAELEDYRNKQEIHDAFGWGYITDADLHRLWDIWDAREMVIANSGKFENRVTEMLERAMYTCGDMFMETLEEFDELQRQIEENRVRIERENSINSYNRYIKDYKFLKE